MPSNSTKTRRKREAKEARAAAENDRNDQNAGQEASTPRGATAIEQTDTATTDHDANSAIPDTSETQQPQEQSTTQFPVLPERRKPSPNESLSSASAAKEETIPVNGGVGISEATGDDVAKEETGQSGQPGQPDGTDKFNEQGTTSRKDQDTRAAGSDEPAKAKAKVRPETAADIAMKSLATRVDRGGKQFKTQEFPGKPHPGNEGTAVKLQTNHFEIELPGLSTVYQYSFTIWPFPTSPRMRRRILYLLLRNSNGFSKAATDYRGLIVSTAKLANEDFSAVFEVDYYGERETGPPTGNERTTYSVSISPAREGSHELKLLDLQTYIQDHTSRTHINPKPLITALNLLLNRMPNQNPMVACLGKNTFYDLDEDSHRWHADLGNPNQLTLEGLVGIYKSVKVCPQKLLMNANTSASAFYVQKSMDWLIHAWSGGDEQRQYGDLVQLTRFIRGLRVQARHGRRRVYTVWGVAEWGPRFWNGRRPTKDVVTFTKKNKKSGKDEQITVKAYFSEEYPDMKWTYAGDLVLNCGSERSPRYLPAESLEVLPGNAFTKLLGGRETADMQKLACQRPKGNKVRLEKVLQLLGIPGTTNDAPNKRFDLKVDKDLLQLSGRLLTSAILEYGSGYRRDDTRSGSWDLKDVKFLHVPQSSSKLKWSWIEFTDRGRSCNAAQVDQYLKALRQYIPQYCPNLQELNDSRLVHQQSFPFNDPSSMAKQLGKFGEAGVSVVFVILQGQNAANYDLLKKIAETQLGLHTICVVKKAGWPNNPKVPAQLPSSGRQVASILMKVNIRLGGRTARVSLSQSEAAIETIFDKNTMIVGADVTHPGPASMREVPSVAAVVASEDADFCYYPASFRCQTSKMEMIEELDVMLGERLDHWKSKNGNRLYPNKIVFYRDGISEGQFPACLSLEWPQIQSVIDTKYNAIGQIPAQVVLLSVQKRHHTRFYPIPGTQLEDKNGNPKPGLVVDDHVTTVDKYDFFLQSHFALIGTARPANYVVLQDQIGCDPDALQKATYWHCFTFGRSTTSISVHPAARYADLACTRARSYLREYYVAGNRCGETFSRAPGGNAVAAWDHTKIRDEVRDKMFYI